MQMPSGTSSTGTHNLLGMIVHGVLLLSIVVAATLLCLERDINGDAVVGLFGAVAATTAGTTAYRAGRQQGDQVNQREGDSSQ